MRSISPGDTNTVSSSSQPPAADTSATYMSPPDKTSTICTARPLLRMTLSYWPNAVGCASRDSAVCQMVPAMSGLYGKRRWYEHVRKAFKASTAIERAL